MQPDTSTTYLKQGQQLQREGRLTEAEATYRQAIELNPIFYGSFRYLGEVLALEGKLDQAVEAYQRAKELNPKALWVHQGLGEVFLQLNKLEDAIACFQTALEINPDFSWAYNGLGECWSLKGNRENAIGAYQKAVELNPDSETFRHNLEKVLTEPDKLSMSNRSVDSASNQTHEVNSERKYKIYDCFAFFNELDILKIRIEELKDVVDKFILVEATKTHSGNPKPLYYQEFIHEFAEYQDKIIHYVVDDMPEVINGDRWPLENHQRDCIIRPLKDIKCNDEDIILISDLDEIPRKEKIEDAINLLQNNKFVIFNHDLYHQHLDAFNSQWWCGTVACKYKDLKVRTATKVRRSDEGFWSPNWKAASIRKEGFQYPNIEKGGWHFSSFGGEKTNRYKLQSFAHAEIDNSKETGIPLINFDVARPTNNEDSLGKYYYDIRDVEGKDIPDYLKKNIRQYRHFLKPKVSSSCNYVEDSLELEKTPIEPKMIEEAIADWRRNGELNLQADNNSFLNSLEPISSFQISPEQLAICSGEIVEKGSRKQLVSPTGNQGLVSFGPYINVPDGFYKIRVNFEFQEDDSDSDRELGKSDQIGYKLDVATERSYVWQEINVYTGQDKLEFFIELVDANNLEIRFWATGRAFAINSIELNLLYPPIEQDLAADYYFNLGKHLQLKGKAEHGGKLHRRLAELNPEGYLDKAIAYWKQAREAEPNGIIYFNLGMLLAQKQQFQEVFDCYQKLLEIQPEKIDVYSDLMLCLAKQGWGEQISDCHLKVLQNSYLATKANHKLALVMAKQGLTTEAITILQKASQKQLIEGEIYETIWQVLNHLGILNKDSFDLPTEISPETTYKYFRENSNYKIINLWSITDLDRYFLEQEGFSIANLELIVQDDIELEELYINSFEGNSKQRSLSKQGWRELRSVKGVHNVKQGNYFKQSIVETGYIYCVCPVSGEILRSNHSFVIELGHTVQIYRFQGDEVFYLLCATWLGEKTLLYFPHKELIIRLHPIKYISDENVINLFKSKAVTFWKKFKKYISKNNQKKEIVAMLGFYPSLGHYYWNELTGIYSLYEAQILGKVDKFLRGSQDVLQVGEIFPEIPCEKIISADQSEDIFQKCIDNNYFVVWVTDLFIKEELASRTYQNALQRCSNNLEFIQEVGTAKQHFPLLCVQVRCHNRMWLSQVEGTANIIKNLYLLFPDLGVVFDGWSRIDKEDPKIESAIKADKIVEEEIKAKIPANIKTYSLIGKTLYETIYFSRSVDLYTGSMGTGLTTLYLIADKPGVVHTSSVHWNDFNRDAFSPKTRENSSVTPVWIPKQYIIDDINNPNLNRNYDCDWHFIYNEIVKLLNQMEIR